MTKRASQRSSEENGSRFSRYLDGLAMRPSPDPVVDFMSPDVDPSSTDLPVEVKTEISNPEADSYSYIESLLEALFVLGKLGHALEVVTQRVPGEIHALIELTLDEVEER